MKKFKKVQSVQIPGIDDVLATTPEVSKDFISKSLEIVHQINLLLDEKDWNQKMLADKLIKTEPEISKWLSGSHNFTLRTLSSIAVALESELIITPWKVKANHMKYLTKVFRASPIKKESKILDNEKYLFKSNPSIVTELAVAS